MGHEHMILVRALNPCQSAAIVSQELDEHFQTAAKRFIALLGRHVDETHPKVDK